MRLRFVAAAVVGVVLAGCDAGSSLVPVERAISTPIPQAALVGPDKYIVVYKSSVTDTRAEIAQHVSAQGAQVERVFQHAVHGWSGSITTTELQRLRNDPHVAWIEPDVILSVQTSQSPVPSWGLDRIDQRSVTQNQTYVYTQTGAGVHFYSLDTGILYSHSDFGGRASAGFDAITVGGNAVDCNGHGTHTTSTAAGSTYGVAKGMTIVGVRVLDCSGNGASSQVIAGIDWVTQNAIKPAVANMSLGGALSPALDQAVAASIASGVTYVISSGNSNADACQQSPADVPSAITVNASDASDARASFSNWGTCTDIFAPGVGITGAWITSNTAYQVLNGTSMASPHVAGAAGLYLQANPNATPAQVEAALTANATQSAISNAGTGSPNRLLYTGFLNTANQPPLAAITAPSNNASVTQGSSVTFTGSGNDPESGALTGASLVWTSSINGQIGTGSTFATTALSVGTHTVTLTAKDPQGSTGIATVSVTVTAATGTNKSPTATIWAPASGTSFAQTGGTYFAGVGRDAEDGTLGGASLVWRSSINGQIGTGGSFTTKLLSPGIHTITLTASDKQGATGVASITITVTGTGPANVPPTAAITAPIGGSSVAQGSSVAFTGTGNDPETGALAGASLVWTSNLNGQIGTGATFSTAALSPGTHTITLTAKDPQGATGTASISITVSGAPSNNKAPTATIWAPVTGTSYLKGAGAYFAGVGRDAEDGTLGGASLVWTSSINGQIGTGASFTTKALSVGTHTITLTATDHLGATGKTTITVVVH